MIEKTRYTVTKDLLEQAKRLEVKDKIVLNEPTGNFFYDPWVIKEEFKSSEWASILNTLPTGRGEARVIVLQPGQTYMAHADIDNRWHLNISGNESYLIDLSKKEMHLLQPDGIWYEMDAGKIHVASNFGQIPRVQLVVRKLLLRCKLASKIKIIIEPSCEQFDYRYQFDNIVSPWLNRLNQYGAIDNFEFDGQKVEFDLAESLKPMLSEIQNSIFRITHE